MKADKRKTAPAAAQITPDKINGRIASLEAREVQLQSEQKQDCAEHNAAVDAFGLRFNARLKEHSEITGSLAELRALLG